ncbi:MAG: hypothetical protein PHU61_04200 [Candidatus Absconditabacteria bacterium]|nr:hypothetical protein [Candidatus Absconditabacteria bacterium]MDD3868698.1 hypothetical protein [Candidatus Absconditabacteria bacterium]
MITEDLAFVIEFVVKVKMLSREVIDYKKIPRLRDFFLPLFGSFAFAQDDIFIQLF